MKTFSTGSSTALVNAARRAVELAAANQSGRADLLWQRASETSKAFATRVATARTRLPDARLLIVVCAPGAVARAPGIVPIEIPPAMIPVFGPPARYRGCYGGRGAGRSWTFGRALIAKAMTKPTLFLCAREFQNSIEDSVHRLLSNQIAALGLGGYFEIQNTTIIGRNGTEFIFSGIRNNTNRIKSLEGVDICFVEEAEKISDPSWEVLIPTIRKPGSEIWLAFNPDLETDPTYERFVTRPPDSAIVVKTTLADNPWAPEALLAEAEYLARVDADAHAHVWLGGCRKASDAQVFKGKYVIDSFTPSSDWDGPYFGADWGFSQDPTTLVRCWIHDRTLYIDHEAYAIGCDIDATPRLFDDVPGAATHTIRADSARPETISYVQRNGYPNMESVKKWTGSVEDGIAHLRSYERIVVHPRCVHTAEEMRLYSFKVGRLTGDIQPDPVDKHNHIIDALRYALEPLIAGGDATEWAKHLTAMIAADASVSKQLAFGKKDGAKSSPISTPWGDIPR